MESGSSAEFRTGPSSNSGGGKHLNSEKKPGVSFSPFTSELTSHKDHFHKNLTSPTNDQTNRHMEAHSTNPFGEPHPPPLSSSHNPFLENNDATNCTHVGAFESEKTYTHVRFDEMPHSSQGNPFLVPTTSTSTDTNPPSKLGKDSKLASESSDHDDILISSMPKHGQQQSSDVAGKHSEMQQNPPVQVMERTPEDPVYRIPLNIFSSDKSNNQWSTASNESLFSIQMGNASFSNDMAWLIKSGELNQMPHSSFQNQETHKFNSISQSSAEQHQGSRVTEERAVETMREVILENSVTTKHTSAIADHGEARSNLLSKSNNHSHNSDGSTQSFAFKELTDGDKTLSAKHVEEKKKQQKQTEIEILTERSNAPQNPKSTPNASQDKWLSCFACCH